VQIKCVRAIKNSPRGQIKLLPLAMKPYIYKSERLAADKERKFCERARVLGQLLISTAWYIYFGYATLGAQRWPSDWPLWWRILNFNCRPPPYLALSAPRESTTNRTNLNNSSRNLIPLEHFLLFARPDAMLLQRKYVCACSKCRWANFEAAVLHGRISTPLIYFWDLCKFERKMQVCLLNLPQQKKSVTLDHVQVHEFVNVCAKHNYSLFRLFPMHQILMVKKHVLISAAKFSTRWYSAVIIGLSA
jgi:hypothetical protein